MQFNAGYAADAPTARGLQSMTLSLLDEGTTTKSSQQIAEEQERLGVEISASGTADRSTVSMSALSANLGAVARPAGGHRPQPGLRPGRAGARPHADDDRHPQQLKDPNAMASRALPVLLYGETHPYGSTGVGDAASVEKFTREDLLDFQQTWLRPDNLEIFVVSDRPLAEVQAELDRRFGQWQAPAVAARAEAVRRRRLRARRARASC